MPAVIARSLIAMVAARRWGFAFCPFSVDVCHQCSSEVNLDGGLDYEHLDEDCVWEGKNENT